MDLVFFQRDNSTLIDPVTQAKFPNPIPRELRRRRQTIAAVIKDGKMLFGRAECQHTDVFSKSEGFHWAKTKAESKPILSVEVPKNDNRLVKTFIKHAKSLLLPEKAYTEHQHYEVRFRAIRAPKPVKVKEKVELHVV